MYIVSKFKDYYDFVVFETDNRKTYVRQEERFSLYSKFKEKKELIDLIRYVSIHTISLETEEMLCRYFIGTVLFCNEFFPYLYDVKNHKYFYSYKSIPAKMREVINKLLSKKAHYSLEFFFLAKEDTKDYLQSNFLINKEKENRKIKFNSLCNVPIVFSFLKDNLHPEIIINGRLQNIKFGKVKTPSEAYTDIYNFIPFIEPELDSNPDDMNRYESKGFDVKLSFRNVK